MKNTNKKVVQKKGLNSTKPNLKEDRQELQQYILQITEELVTDKFSDKSLDRENEIIKLVGGREITLRQVREIQSDIANKLREYEPHFRNEYYKEIYRLHGWKMPEGKISQKPHVVARYTNEIIYNRFSKEVLPALQHLNPFYLSIGKRMFKHFQWLTDEGIERLENFIDDAIRVMKTCKTWYEFRVKHSNEFGLGFQLNIFEKGH